MNTVIIGAQWGDEGKGKIVDYLSNETDIVVRYSGGANAGHTVVANGKQYALHLIPSGIINPSTTVVLGTGMVIDPQALEKELNDLTEWGINWKGRVLISDRAHLIFQHYKEEDIESEKKRSKPIGTTGRGIGVAYEKKSQRSGVRVCDSFLADKSEYSGMIINLVDYMYQNRDKNIIFEGAQGALLDIDTGSYPFVSSGSSCAGGACTGGGIGPKDIDEIAGVFKAYTTRVGNGPLPTEFGDEDDYLCKYIRDTGREYGVTTGRARRCGYLDLVALKHAVRANSIDYLVMTHLDVYDTLPFFKVCTEYDINGTETDVFPSSIDELEVAKPLFSAPIKGWKTSTKEAKNFSDLPFEAQYYIGMIENYVGVPIKIISVGYDRSETITRQII